jgi:hypothetical protein
MEKFGAFSTVPIAVKAVRLWVDGYYDIGGKGRLCPAGSWLVELADTPRGHPSTRFCIPDDVFREGYRPTDTESESMWTEQTKSILPQWPNGEPIKLN